MPVYATRTDLVNLSLTAGALTGISTTKQDAALQTASDVASGYLNARYRMPITAYGTDLTKAVCDMAALTLMKGRGFNPETADAQMFIAGDKAAIDWLKGVAAGKISPVGLVDSAPGGINTDDLADGARSPYVVQLSEATPERDEFWQGDAVSAGGGVGTPKRRGW